MNLKSKEKEYFLYYSKNEKASSIKCFESKDIKTAILKETEVIQDLLNWVSDKAFNKELISINEINNKIKSLNFEIQEIIGFWEE